MKPSKTNLSIVLLILLHGVGVLGIGFQLKPDLVTLSWMNLLLTALLMLWNKTEKPKPFYCFLFLVLLLGLSVEIIGVATGFPFGSYYYGDALGWKVWGVPVVLGVNWWILVYASIHTAAFLTKNKTYRIILPPALMLAVDTVIEPLCATLDFWYWKDAHVPWQNYLSWYIISLAFMWAYYSWFSIEKPNRVAIAAFLVQLLFFTTLNQVL